MVKTSTKEEYIIAFMILGIATLILANIIILGTRTAVIYSVTFSGTGSFTINDGRISFVIDNDIDNSTKFLRIYGINNTDDIRISASDLLEVGSGRIIRDNQILFNNTTPSLLGDIPPGAPAKVSISLNNSGQPINREQTGLYHGQLFITGNLQASIPIIVEIKPTFDQVIIWVVNGIAIAIIFWKLVKFFNERYSFTVNKKTLSREHNWAETPLAFRQFLKKKKITSGTIAKNAILDVGSISFGIVVALVALLNNDYVNSIHILDVYTIIILIGIGLGIGSLKEYIHQASEPHKHVKD